jgi:phosphoglycolate phosphatase
VTTGLHPALDDIDLVVLDKDGTRISFEAMWAGWTRALAGRLELATKRPVAGDVFTTIGFDPTSDRVLPAGPLATATMAEIRDLVGAVLRRWCPRAATAQRLLGEAWFEPDPVADAVPLADLPEVLGTIHRSGRAIAVATTDDRVPTERTVAGLGLGAFVGAVLCGDDPPPTKPDPAAVLALAARAGVLPQRVAVVGDTPADLGMARGAGARAIGVASGVTAADELRPHGHVLLGSIAELLRA